MQVQVHDAETSRIRNYVPTLNERRAEVFFLIGIEITPVMRLVWKDEGQEITDPKDLIERYQGKWVRITGWMFYDKFHESGADTTDPGDQRGESPNWRATAWEIHPITSIELIDPPD